MNQPEQKYLSVTAAPVHQGEQVFYIFAMKASDLWSRVQISQRQEDKDEGYQRALSLSRVQRISKYVLEGGTIPGAILISLVGASFDKTTNILSIPDRPDAGWVIDGQHRLVGAYTASTKGLDPEVAVMAALGLDPQKQIELFVTINKEAKGVPSSLYIDLLKYLPKSKTDKEIVEERIADIAKALNQDEQSSFYQRIISTRSPSKGEVSLVNFARIMRPLMTRPSGILSFYTPSDQGRIIDNYYQSLKTSFKKIFESGLFYRTVGFGAAWRAFPLIFNKSISEYKGFTTKNCRDILAYVEDFDFLQWGKMGTGTAAEIQAGEDLIAALEEAFQALSPDAGSIKL